MKILVTGGSGLTGMALHQISKSYPDKDFLFCGRKDCDLTRSDDTSRFIALHKPDTIIHLAAVCGGTQLSINHPGTLLRDNLFMNMNVLEAARLCNTSKVVMLLSTGMYPQNAQMPVCETSIHDGPPHLSNYGYAFAKRLVEPAIRAYRHEFGMNIIGLVPNGIFGEYANYQEEKSVVVSALIRRMYEQKDTRDEIVVWGDGTPLREYTHASDVARAIMWCLDNYNNENILNVGSTEEHSVKAIAYMIADILGIDRKRITFDSTKPSGVHRRSTDNSRFVSLSGFQYLSLKAGLEQTIEWFCSNHDREDIRV